MYCFKEVDSTSHLEPGEEREGDWTEYEIYDSAGDRLATVFTQGEAEALVTHLNR